MRASRLLIALYLGIASPCFAQEATWTQKCPSQSPPPRGGGHAMVYDAAHGQVVLFGGVGTSGFLADTWVWDGNNWIQKFPATSPSARCCHVMVYDSARGEVVLFGGNDGSNAFNDTWVWDGTNWTQKFPATSPPPRANKGGGAYDAARQQFVMFGGEQFGAVFLGDTWVWDGSNWAQKFPAHSPSARDNHTMAYDAIRQQVVLFGGSPCVFCILADTWVWDGADWTQKSPSIHPPERYDSRMAYDTARQQILLFGGVGLPCCSNYLDDTWVWDGTNWTQKFPTASPSARAVHAMASDAADEQVVLFAGSTSTVALDDTWVWGSATTCGPPPAACQPPPGRAPFYKSIIPTTPGFNSCPPQDFSKCLTLDANGNCLMNVVQDSNNNQFQLWCMKPLLPNLHIFYWFGLFYLPAGGAYKFAGKCPYEGGQDQGIIYYSAPSVLSQPSCFIRSDWQVVDAGFFDDELAFVPWATCLGCKPYSWVYDFNVATNMTTSKHINPSGVTIGVSTQDPLPDFNNLPPVLDLSAFPAGGAPMGLTIPGDVNVDGRVDCTDVAIVRSSLDKRNGDPGVSAAADIDRDNVVDIRDLAIVVENFTVPGTLCPSLVTFELLESDIADSRELGLIDNPGIANSLSRKVEAASEAAARGQAQTATNILNAFTNEVQAQQAKHIFAPAAAVLLNDASSLIRKINQ